MKAAIFDMDGTLLDSMKMWGKSLPRFLDELHLPREEKFSEDIEFMSMDEIADYLILYYKLSLNPRELKAYWKESIYRSYISEVKPKPYAIEYLKKLKSEGVKISLATLTEHYLTDRVMKEMGLSQYFDYILTTEDVDNIKKDRPDLYLKCASLMGVEPSDCVVFEDSFYPIESAVKTGFKVYAVEDEEQLPIKEKLMKASTRYITSFKELLD